MDCNFIQKQLIAYQDNTLPKEVKEMVSGHVATCEDCRKQLDMLVTLENELEALKNEEPAPFLFTRMKARMDAEKPVLTWWQPAGYTVAASLVMGLMVGILIGKLTITSTEIVAAEIEMNDVFNDVQLESAYQLIQNQN